MIGLTQSGDESPDAKQTDLARPCVSHVMNGEIFMNVKVFIFKGILCLCLLHAVVCHCVVAQQAVSEPQQAIADAKRDANAATTKNFLIGSGIGLTSCMLSYWSFYVGNAAFVKYETPLGIGCSTATTIASALYISAVEIPPVKLLGKSPTYVAAYTKAYKSRLRWVRGASITYGCITGAGVNFAIISFFDYFNDQWHADF